MKKIILIMLVLILVGSFVSAITKDELRGFLRTELTNYFDGKQTLLSVIELRQVINLYFTLQAGEINFSSSGLSQDVVNIIIASETQETNEEFRCTLTATGTETYEEEQESVPQEGRMVLCCKNRKCGIWGLQKCEEKAWSDCYPTKSYLKGKGKQTEACHESLGLEWSGSGCWPGLANIESCAYTSTQTTSASSQRTATQSLSFELKQGEVENLGTIDLMPSQQQGGSIGNITYMVQCQDSRINAYIQGNNIYAEWKS